MSSINEDHVKDTDQNLVLQKGDPEQTGKKIIFLIGLFAFLLPTLIYIISKHRGYPLESSISHNYFTNLREVFTGILISIGCMMLCYSAVPNSNSKSDFYKSIFEKILSFISAICAILIAFYPTSPHKIGHPFYSKLKYDIDVNQYTFNEVYNNLNQDIHNYSAITLFSILALFCLVFFPNKNKYKYIYWFFGTMIILGMIIAYIGTKSTDLNKVHYVYYGETISLFSFGISWMLKGIEDQVFKLLK